MLTRIEAHCAQCGDVLVDAGEYMRNFLGKPAANRICADCQDSELHKKHLAEAQDAMQDFGMSK